MFNVGTQVREDDALWFFSYSTLLILVVFLFPHLNLKISILGTGCDWCYFMAELPFVLAAHFSEKLNPLFDVSCWLVIKPVKTCLPNSCGNE